MSLGDLGLAYQAFKVAVSVDPTHGEALNNIAVLEMRRQKTDVARSCLSTAISVNNFLFEPLYNYGTLDLLWWLFICIMLITATCFQLFFYSGLEISKSHIAIYANPSIFIRIAMIPKS